MMGYGLGHFVGVVEGHRLAGHPSINPGCDSKMVYAPDDGVAVIALANWMHSFGPHFPADDAAVDILYELMGISVEQ